MVCRTPTSRYPDGRTGTQAGYKAHRNANEVACDPCLASTRIRKNPRTSEQLRADNLRQKYGMTIADYDAMLESQFGGCAVCGSVTPGGTGGFHVDHDHSCCPGKKSCGGCVRGLLCANCNQGLGQFNDDVERMRLAIRYLEGGRG